MASFLGRDVILIFVLICGMAFIYAEDLKEEDIQRDARDRNGIWFGPRLGKRSMEFTPEHDRDTFYRMLEAADRLKFYYDQLQFYGPQVDEPEENKVTKKVIFTPKLGRAAVDEDKTYEVDFTPRLGRRRLRDGAVTPSDSDAFRRGQEQIESRSTQYFSPRLGRSPSVNYQPRLGRNLIYDLLKQVGVIIINCPYSSHCWEDENGIDKTGVTITKYRSLPKQH